MGLFGPPLLQVGSANPSLSLGVFNHFLEVSPTADPDLLQGSPPSTSPVLLTQQNKVGLFVIYFLIKMLAWDFLSYLLLDFLFAVKGITIS